MHVSKINVNIVNFSLSDTSSLTGNIDGWARESDGPMQSMLRRRGFGWMLEVDTEDADFEKPLL